MGKNRKAKGSSGRGLCCGYCADSKFPCVNMEKAMQAAKDADEHPESGPKKD
ncbi:MAG: hypothetical protein ACYC99_03990 [Candidatus Geothermincolia bacterium]